MRRWWHISRSLAPSMIPRHRQQNAAKHETRNQKRQIPPKTPHTERQKHCKTFFLFFFGGWANAPCRSNSLYPRRCVGLLFRMYSDEHDISHPRIIF